MKPDLSLSLHGVVLVILGLLAGFATAAVAAPTMALSAHNIGVIQGTLAIALACLWPVLTASGHSLALTRLAIVVGFYSNWLGAILASIWSAKAMAFVTGHAMPDQATDWQEWVVAILFNLSALVLLGLIHVAYVLIRMRGQASQ